MDSDFSIEFICISPIVMEQLSERLIYTVQIGFKIKILRLNFPLQHLPSLTTIPFYLKVNMNTYFVPFLMNLKFDTNIFILIFYKVYIFLISFQCLRLSQRRPNIIFSYLRKQEFCIKKVYPLFSIFLLSENHLNLP